MKRFFGYIGLILTLSLIMALHTGDAGAAVQLISFTATADTTDVTIRWVTATEFETAGFFVQRSLLEGGSYTDIPEDDPLFFPSAGDGVTGAEYVYTDTDVETGTTYYYKLHVINYDEQEQYFGPISATPGGTPTPTRTASPTSVSATTVTRTRTPGGTQTPVRTSTPTQTVSSAATTTPTQTPTISLTPSVTSTLTPYVIPEIGASPFAYPPIFIPPSTSTPFIPGAESPSQADAGEENPFLSWAGFGLGAILALWVFLAGWWIYFSSRLTK